MSEEAQELSEEELLEESLRRDQADAYRMARLDFSPLGEDCPWIRESPLHGILWRKLTGEEKPAPDAASLFARVEVARRGGGGWLNVEPCDRWTVDQVSRTKLLDLFGGGRLWKASIRYKGDTMPGSTVRIDLTNESDAPKPIPGDDPAPRASTSAPTAGAVAPTAEGLDPVSMMLGQLPVEHRGTVGFLVAMQEREMERQQNFYKAALDLARVNAGAQPAGGSAELTRRLERDVDDARRERDTLRGENARLTNEVFNLRQRLAIVEAYGAHVGGAPSPVWDALTKVMNVAAPEFAKAVGSRVNPQALMDLARVAVERLPADQIAGALGAAGG